MTILSAQSIRKRGLIEPFVERETFPGTKMTYGLGPASYDVRIRGTCTLPPGSSHLVTIQEKLTMPADVAGEVKDKSTWARKFIAVQNTWIDPGFCGYMTLELTNHGDETVVIHDGMPVAQFVFSQLDEPTEKPYVGKYQNQPQEPVPPIVEATTPDAAPVLYVQEYPEATNTAPSEGAAVTPSDDAEPSPKAMADEDVQAVTYTDRVHAESGITTVVDPVTGDVQGWTVPALKPPSTEEIDAAAEEDGKA